MTGQPNLLGLYQPGTTVLHRLPAGVKLVALCGFGATAFAIRSPELAVAALGAASGCVIWSRTNVFTFMRALRPLLVVAAILLGFHSWQADLVHGVQVTSRMLAIVVLATVVTATTSSDAILDAVTRALHPLRHFGVNPDRVGLAIGLMLRAVPALLSVAYEAREAARARGLERSPRALLVPMAVRSVAHARATGEALAARGLGDV
ncbi:energy-coupling factor transporter transmembrane component T family protein [Hoyosella altamirensis]|uniref:Biotin transport system permease protein n=1 Tax=Hoyosella altamirensis TaxID=616997 RepID=A0A839RJ75_9ACTN|nr:energy-coupling factor transporter transmembrane protein EcfT [Hoyosella altamirensis]MBB3036882.1 biotin transport system permease protein [Hoyosella altamirensis]